jgi:hypothetical protein
MNLRGATATREKHSKRTEGIEGVHSVMIAPSSDGLPVCGIPDVIPFTRQEKWLFPRVSNGMHEMQKWATLFFRAHQNPYAVRSKDFLNWQKSWKSMLDCKRRTMRRKVVRQLSLCIQQWWLWSEQNGLLLEHLTFTKLVRGGCHHSL